MIAELFASLNEAVPLYLEPKGAPLPRAPDLVGLHLAVEAKLQTETT